MEDCYGGYVCTGRSQEAAPTTLGGYECPTGAYCPAGTTDLTGTLCDAGTYNSYLGAHNVTYCIACGQGEACDSPGTDYPDVSSCDAGKTCDELGNIEDTPEGTYSPAGVAVQLRCPHG